MMSRLATPIGAGLAYFCLATSMIILTSNGHGVAAVWPPNSILLALMLLRPRSRWWSILVAGFLANVAANLMTRGTLEAPFLLGLANCAEVTIAALGLKRGVQKSGILSSPATVLRFVLWAGLLAPIASGLCGASTTAILFGESFRNSFITWIISDSLGLLVCTPFLYAFLNGDYLRAYANSLPIERAEALLLHVLNAAVALLVFSSVHLPLLFLIALPMTLVTFRLGWLGTKMGLMIVAAIGLVCTIKGLGPFWIVSADPRFQAFFFQFFIAASLLTVMPIAAALSARDDAMQQLAGRERVLRLLAAQSPNLLLSFDTEGTCQSATGAGSALFGRPPESFIGDAFSDFALDPTPLRTAHDRVRADPDCCDPIEFQAAEDPGRYLEASFRLTLNEKGQCIGTLASIHDITARKAQELAWARSATTDSLTGVLNREGFLTRLQETIEATGPDGFSLAVIDIDRFKLINDNGGHVVGDIVLKHIAATMEHELRQSDIIGRLGGDEFVILLSSADWAQAQEICNRLVTVIRETPIPLPSGHTLKTAISCGLARYYVGLDAEQLIEEADKALYRAKRTGRDRVAAI